MTVKVTLSFINARDAEAALSALEVAAMNGDIAEPFEVHTSEPIGDIGDGWEPDREYAAQYARACGYHD